MIIIKIKGGLGNQLFQYAVGRAVALHHRLPLKLDLTIFKTYKLHRYLLDHFAIQADIATEDEIIKLKVEIMWCFLPCEKRVLLKENRISRKSAAHISMQMFSKISLFT